MISREKEIIRDNETNQLSSYNYEHEHTYSAN